MCHEPDPVKSWTVGGTVRVEIWQDMDPPNPRDNDNVGKMVIWDGSVDESPLTRPAFVSMLRQLAYDALDAQGRPPAHDGDIPFEHVIRIVQKHYVTETIHERYDGSLFFGGEVEETDGGCDGLAWVSVSDLPKHLIDREQAAKNLQGEIEEYGAYLSGDAYGYVVTDTETGEEDSCWGFLGIECAIEEATTSAKSFRFVPQSY